MREEGRGIVLMGRRRRHEGVDGSGDDGGEGGNESGFAFVGDGCETLVVGGSRGQESEMCRVGRMIVFFGGGWILDGVGAVVMWIGAGHHCENVPLVCHYPLSDSDGALEISTSVDSDARGSPFQQLNLDVAVGVWELDYERKRRDLGVADLRWDSSSDMILFERISTRDGHDLNLRCDCLVLSYLVCARICD